MSLHVLFTYLDGSTKEAAGEAMALRRSSAHKKGHDRPVRVDVTGDLTSNHMKYLCAFYKAGLSIYKQEGVFVNGKQCFVRWNQQGTDFDVYTEEATL